MDDDDVTPRLQCDIELNLSGPTHTTVNKWTADALRKLAEEVREEEAAKSPMAKKVNESFKQFHKTVSGWGSISEKVYYESIAPQA